MNCPQCGNEVTLSFTDEPFRAPASAAGTVVRLTLWINCASCNQGWGFDVDRRYTTHERG